MATSTLQPQTKTEAARPWQFSVRSLILAVLFLSFVLAWLRWFWTDNGFAAFYPGCYGLCSVGILLFACIELRRATRCSSAWNLVAAAWFVVIGNLFYGILRAFSVVSADNPDVLAELLQEGVYIATVSAVSLPVFFTVPIIYALVFRYRSCPQAITQWIYGALAISIVDTVLFVTLVSVAFGTWGR